MQINVEPVSISPFPQLKKGCRDNRKKCISPQMSPSEMRNRRTSSDNEFFEISEDSISNDEGELSKGTERKSDEDQASSDQKETMHLPDL